MKLMAGTAKTDITPNIGSPIVGTKTVRHAKTIHDNLHARALVLNNNKCTVALVVCDLFAISGKSVRNIRKLVEKTTGIPGPNIMIAATHTHTGGPSVDMLVTDEDKKYTAWIEPKIADAVHLASQNMKPARLGTGIGKEERVSFTKRIPMNGKQGPIDPDVGVIYIESENGRPLAAVVNFALHYVKGGNSPESISADYFGCVDNVLQKIKGDCFMGMVLNGACGDINAGKKRESFKKTEQVAETVAGEALGVIGTMELRPELQLEVSSETVRYKRKKITDEDLKLSEKILKNGPKAKDSNFSWAVKKPVHPELRYPIYARECIRLSKMPEELETEVQAIKIGDSAIVTLPGEIFTEIGMQIKSRSPFKKTFIGSLANDFVGYCVTDEVMLYGGGYPTWAAKSALPAPGMEKLLVDTSVRLLEKLKKSN